MSTRQFYSRSANLIISAVKPKIITLTDGSRIQGEEKIIVFNPLTGGAGSMNNKMNWGVFNTDDPELVEFLEDHIADLKSKGEVPDILTPEDWNKEIIPKETQVKALEAEVAALRRKVSAGNQVAEILDKQTSPDKRGRTSKAK